MRHKFWTSEKLLNLSAIIVGLRTLIVFVYQTPFNTSMTLPQGSLNIEEQSMTDVITELNSLS